MLLKARMLVRQAAHLLRAIAIDPQRKPLGAMARESASLYRRDRELPLFYFTNLAYRRGAGPPAGYVGRRDRRRIRDLLGTPRDVDLDDKIRFYARAERAGLPIPRRLAIVFPDRVELNGHVRPGAGRFEIAEALGQARLHAANGSIFIKPHAGTRGFGCFRLDAHDDERALTAAAKRIAGGTFIVQETLVQHPVVERVSPNAIGSLRAHTYRKEGKTRIVSVFMRFALGNGVVDALRDGTLLAPVDEHTGRVSPPARNHFQFGGREFDRHPVTGASLEMTLPDWPRVLELVDRTSETFERPFVGWDIAFTADGPVVTEGNNQPDLLLAQLATKGLLNHPGFRDVVGPIVEGRSHGPGMRVPDAA